MSLSGLAYSLQKGVKPNDKTGTKINLLIRDGTINPGVRSVHSVPEKQEHIVTQSSDLPFSYTLFNFSASNMDKQFGEALERAHVLLKSQGAIPALVSVKAFFEENQEAIKAYFDSKSLEETAREMKVRMDEVQKLVQDVKKPDEAATFMKGLNDFLQEEFQHRVEEMQSVN